MLSPPSSPIGSLWRRHPLRGTHTQWHQLLWLLESGGSWLISIRRNRYGGRRHASKVAVAITILKKIIVMLPRMNAAAAHEIGTRKIITAAIDARLWSSRHSDPHLQHRTVPRNPRSFVRYATFVCTHNGHCSTENMTRFVIFRDTCTLPHPDSNRKISSK